MVRRAYIKSNTYQDSVSLMRLSALVSKMEGVERASVMMGTALNKKVLEEIDMFTPEVETAQTSDMMVIIEAQDESVADKAYQRIEEELNMENRAKEESGERLPISIVEAVNNNPDCNIIAISAPGEYAAAEAMKALKKGLNVFLFSDNVSIESEVELKKYAKEHDLLVMGPDCGTTVLRGVPLGFANVVRSGGIGLVGASGTGLQEVMCRIDQMGGGVSSAIGTGSHDLSLETGGISMLQAMDVLEADADTKIVVLVSKPPESSVAAKVLERAAKMRCPVVACFIGAGDMAHGENVYLADTLELAAQIAVALSKGEAVPAAAAKSEAVAVPEDKFLRGLYSGGTLASEALNILSLHGVKAYSNLTKGTEYSLADPLVSKGNCIVDMGDDKFTVGKPHPMINYDERVKRIRKEAADSSVTVFLLDVLLGFGSNLEPAAAIGEVISESLSARPELKFVVHVCGTEGDKQGLEKQCSLLREVGAQVELSHVAAVEKALSLLAGEC